MCDVKEDLRLARFEAAEADVDYGETDPEKLAAMRAAVVAEISKEEIDDEM